MVVDGAIDGKSDPISFLYATGDAPFTKSWRLVSLSSDPIPKILVRLATGVELLYAGDDVAAGVGMGHSP